MIKKINSLSLEISKSNRFPRFQAAFEKRTLLQYVIFKQNSGKFLVGINRFSEDGISVFPILSIIK